ncbi:hypothetical protein CR513_30642, partial [Mucuna pruriens]
MQEELEHFQKNDVWKLVSLPKDKSIIDKKWVFKNNLDENGKGEKKSETLLKLFLPWLDWYEKLSSFLMENGFEREKVDNTLFYKNCDSQSIIVQIYVDDIIFGATDKSLCEEFSKLM